MKYFLLFTVFFHSLLYSQIGDKVDSVTYYSKLATENIKNNNYKEALSYTQKSIDYCKRNKNIEAQAAQTYNLGKIYFDLNIHNDAIELLSKSIVLFNRISKEPNEKVAKAYYYISLSCVEKKNYILAESSIL
jgi:tetratricopeptide (TPR) repeat protein